MMALHERMAVVLQGLPPWSRVRGVKVSRSWWLDELIVRWRCWLLEEGLAMRWLGGPMKRVERTWWRKGGVVRVREWGGEGEEER